MKKPLYLLCSAALLGVALASCSGSSKKTEETASTSAPADTAQAAPAEQAPIARGRTAAVHVALSVESVDQEKRRQIYAQVQQILARDLPYINLWYFDNVVVHSRRVRNLRPNPPGNYDYLATLELAQ